MYRRPKFLEILDEVRQKMSREADYDVDLFAEMVRNENLKLDQTQKENEKSPNISYNQFKGFAPEPKR